MLSLPGQHQCSGQTSERAGANLVAMVREKEGVSKAVDGQLPLSIDPPVEGSKI